MISKETDPSVKIILSGLLLFVLGALVYWFLNSPVVKKQEVVEEIIPEFFDYGVVYDSIYCNSFFEFKIQLFKGHEIYYQTYDLVQKSLIKYDTVPLSPTLPTEVDTEVLLHIEPEFVDNVQDFLKKNSFSKDSSLIPNFNAYLKEKSKRELFGADYQLRISCHRLANESLLQHMAKYENLHHPNYGTAKTTLIDGISFREYHGIEQQQNFIMGMRTKNIITYVTELYGFVLFVDLFYETEEQKCLLLDMVDQLDFATKAATTI